MIRVFRFGAVGVLNTLIHFSIFYLLLNIAQWHYLAASLAGFVVAVTNSYVLNKYWTFAARGSGVGSEFVRFLLVSVLALGFNLMCLMVLIDGFDVAPLGAQIVAIVLTLLLNFSANKKWVFAAARGMSG
jgi:putative flippase GtrA